MTSLARVRAALEHRETDRVPRLLYEEAIGYTPPVWNLLSARCSPKTPRDFFDMDITRVEENPTTLPRHRFTQFFDQTDPPPTDQLDEWGVWWKTGAFLHFAHVQSPLANAADVRDLDAYPWPDLDAPARYTGLADRVATLHTQGLAVCAFAGSIFERAWYLRGMEQLMLDLHESPPLARAILDRAAHYQRIAAEYFARAGVDIIITGDDVAGQHGLLMSIDMWRTFLKPLQTATARAIKDANPSSYVFYHSDGNIEPLIDELIDTGIDILNPLQPECVNPARIKQQYGHRLSLWGGVSVQKTLPLGTPDDVKTEVRQRLRDLAQNGGYILAPAHVLGPEVPWENITAFFEAAQ